MLGRQSEAPESGRRRVRASSSLVFSSTTARCDHRPTRLTEAPLLSLLGGPPPKHDQVRLLGLQLQPELREPLA